MDRKSLVSKLRRRPLADTFRPRKTQNGAHFQRGQKPVYLPDFTLTLLRSPFLPPTFAKFIVPLHLNKLDMRDYMWNAYGIRCANIRSFVQQAKMRQDSPDAKQAAPRRWYRGKSVKKMTIEMEHPFVWPNDPEDWTPYQRDLYKNAHEYSEKEQQKMLPNHQYEGPTDRETLREQAERLRRGEEKWKPVS